jgi:hypothetical protein
MELVLHETTTFRLDDICFMFRGMELWGYFVVLFCESSIVGAEASQSVK